MLISILMQACWTYSISLDGSNTRKNSDVFCVWIKVPTMSGLLSLHLAAFPVLNQTANTLSQTSVTLLHALDPKWQQKLLANTTDGCNTMTGRLSGLKTQLQIACGNLRLIFTWCCPHQLNLFNGEMLKVFTIDGKPATDRILKLQSAMRESKYFEKLPRYDKARWTSMEGVTDYVRENRATIDA
eukprot:GHVU01196209.1.p1 GENE.GHVU01196209.1~~GHVU01196209.1.p1  ORF type:complete len:185 (+),score=15.33 GHVU01196209.1:573-1127(+)